MKKRFHALMLCAAVLCGTCPAVPVAAEETSLSQAAEQSDAVLTDFLTRIAGWDGASLSDCVVLPDSEGKAAAQLLTPVRRYELCRYRQSRFRVYLDEDTALDPDAVLEKWISMLRETGCPEQSLRDFTSCTLTPADGGYDIETWQDEYDGITLADCLSTFPNVKTVDAQYCCHTSSRPNIEHYLWLCFACDSDPADFLPAALTERLSDCHPEHAAVSNGTYYLTFPAENYAACLTAARYLQTLSAVHDLSCSGVTTAMSDQSPDAAFCDSERTVIYARDKGDLNGDSRLTVADCVLLARIAAEDAALHVTDQMIENADMNSDGFITSEDTVILLKTLAGTR
ncbi:MAG: dockerin type I repeat-containing protein [Oscillospiraceae bacterium]|nr:dockerin type I repeat-containing protein [Oscillospiraceae bacterium]